MSWTLSGHRRSVGKQSTPAASEPTRALSVQHLTLEYLGRLGRSSRQRLLVFVSPCSSMASLLSGIATLACLLSALAAAPGAQAAALPVDQNEASQKSAAVTFASGITGTTTSGSPRNPSILHLASVQDHAAMDPELSELNKLMQDCGATFYLEQTRDMTMFMPTNAAVKALLPVDLHKLPWEIKWRLLQYHIVPQEIINVEDIPLESSKTFSTWEGSNLKVTRKRAPGSLRAQSAPHAPSVYLVNEISTVVSDPPRIENFNGASYKIDRFLIPPDLDLRSVEVAPVEQRQNPEVKQHEQRERARANATTRTSGRPAAKNRGGEEPSSNAPTARTSQNRKHRRDGTTAAGLPAGPGPVGSDSQPAVGNGPDAPDFLQRINQQHARWSQDLYQADRLGAARSPGSAEAQELQAMHGLVGNAEVSVSQADSALVNPVQSSHSITSLAIEEEPSAYPSTAIEIDQNGPRPRNFGVPLSADSGEPSFAPHPLESLLVGNNEEQAELASPSIAALGLTDGVLPEEELVTHFWSRPKQGVSSGTTSASSPEAPGYGGSENLSAQYHVEAKSSPFNALTNILALGRTYRM